MPPSSSEIITVVQFPSITPVGLREERAERLDAIDLPELYRRVAVWIEARPLMKWSDSRPEMVGSLIAGEIKEFLEETNYGSPKEVDWPAAAKEKVDIAFFVIALLFGNNLNPDYDKVWRSVDGLGKRSALYDWMRELAINIVYSDINKVADQILILWTSAIVNYSVALNLHQVLDQVLVKNTGNYPVELMQTKMLPTRTEDRSKIDFSSDYFGSLSRLVHLPPGEYAKAFDHRVRCLRLIRQAVKLTHDSHKRPHWLVPADYQKYAFYILDHRHHETSFWQLSVLLAQERGIDWQLLVNVEKLEHRAVPGLSQPSGLIFSSNQRQLESVQSRQNTV